MTKLKIEHGVSRVRRAKLQASVDQSVADDIQSLADWSNNEPQYIINQLLRFALLQEEDFQRYKTTLVSDASQSASKTKTASGPVRAVVDTTTKPEPGMTSIAARA